ncbi:MAG TPA: SRPBCC family protein [Ferruginibacter sp.]|nr:SRPBCC family protein [Ferruginibacter sp.]
MRFIKPFIIGITGLFIVVTLLSLLIPSRIRVSRATVINASPDKILAQLTELKNWPNWHPLFKKDSVTITYATPSNTQNAYCDITYNGKITHLQVTGFDSSSIRFLLTSKGEDDIENELSVTPVENGQVQVEWKALTILPWYPWEKFYGIFIDNLTGSFYEKSLEGLKTYLESK